MMPSWDEILDMIMIVSEVVLLIGLFLLAALAAYVLFS